MKSFFRQYSYSIIKMFVNQFAISIFGIVLAMATLAANNTVLTWIVSIFSIVFYLFLIYTMTWEIGAKDRISVDVGKMVYKPFIGFWMALVANIPNLLIALCYSIASPFLDTYRWAQNLNAVTNLLSALLEGMYRGLLSVIVLPNQQKALFHFWWTYFLIVIPALVTSLVAYIAGFKNFRMFAQYFNKKPNQAMKK